jgi:hypothetical protein
LNIQQPVLIKGTYGENRHLDEEGLAEIMQVLFVAVWKTVAQKS